MFPDAGDRAAAERELDRYGAKSSHNEVDRVRLAVLKLAGPDLDKLRQFVDSACTDYRDVLAYAEYPEQMSRPPRDANAGVLQRDRQQYEDWLNGDDD